MESSLSDIIIGEKRSVQSSHKKESKSRIKSDALDREGIQKKLQIYIDPLDPDQHPDEIVNIVSGRVAPSSVNINAIEIGRLQMQESEAGWPTGFYNTISKRVVKTMTVTKKHVQIREVKVFDTSLIYSRVIGVQASSR